MYDLRIIGIDPGETVGVAVIEGGRIVAAFDCAKEVFFDKVTTFLLHRRCIVAVEDIVPYSLRLTPNVVSTCKWIGEAVYRLKNASGEGVEMVLRSQVKEWVFNSFQEVVLPLVLAKIEAGVKKGKYLSKDGSRRKPHFVFVNDQIVKKAMTKLWNLPVGKVKKSGDTPASRVPPHAIQALAVASFMSLSRGMDILPLAGNYP